MHATTEQIADLLGDVDPLVAERIIATDATEGEIEEALALVEDERRTGELHPATSPRVCEVREILEDLLDERSDEIL